MQHGNGQEVSIAASTTNIPTPIRIHICICNTVSPKWPMLLSIGIFWIGMGIANFFFLFSLLCAPPCVLLTELGKNCAYDLAVGVNGTLWVSSQSPRDAIAVKMAIEHWDRDGQLDDRGVRSLVKELCQE